MLPLQQVSQDVQEEPSMGSQGSQARGAIQVGQDAEATRVSEDHQGCASPLGVLRIMAAPAGPLSQHSGGKGLAHRGKINTVLKRGLFFIVHM